MKYLSIILAFSIFTMSVIPCSDGHTCEEKGEKISLSHDHSEDEKDHCSPFCACSCCGMKINFQSDIEPNKQLSPLVSYYQFSYSFLYSFSFANAVWHPPTFC